MAESITEGTLKQWSKQIGDKVNQDDEVATIETDKVRVMVSMRVKLRCNSDRRNGQRPHLGDDRRAVVQGGGHGHCGCGHVQDRTR